VRALFLDQAAKIAGCAASELSVQDGRILRNGTSTGQDYWTFAASIDLSVKANGAGICKEPEAFTAIGLSQPRVDLPTLDMAPSPRSDETRTGT
jgi:hypothetical protein